MNLWFLQFMALLVYDFISWPATAVRKKAIMSTYKEGWHDANINKNLLLLYFLNPFFMECFFKALFLHIHHER